MLLITHKRASDQNQTRRLLCMMMMALLVKFSFTSLGSACDLKLELEIHRQEKDMTARNTERMKKGESTWKARAPWLK